MRNLWALVAVVLAGCAGTTVEDGPVTSRSTSSTSATENPAEITPLFAGFEDCPGFASIVTFPGYENPGRPPGNWSDHAGISSNIHHRMFSCEHFSWGAFERGPVDFMFEAHSNMRIPPDCRHSGVELYLTLHAIWVSDPEVADFLNVTYGLRAIPANFSRADSTVGEAQRNEWRWRTPEGESFLAYHQVVANVLPNTSVLRYFWAHGSTMWALDLTETRQITGGQSVLTPGKLMPPTLFAESGQTDYPGRGEADLGAELTAGLTQFADHHCKEVVLASQ